MTLAATPVLPPRRILCCVTEGTLSDAALRATVRLAGRCDARADFLHVLELPTLLSTRFSREQTGAMAAEGVKRRRAQIQAHFAHSLPELEVAGQALEARLEVVAGDPAGTVLAEAAEREVDLIVLGENGHRHQLDFGGTARAVLAKSHAHVLVQTRDTGPVRRILVPIDLSPFSLAALAGALSLARALNATLRVLHVHENLPLAAFGARGAWGVPSGIDFVALRADAEREFERALAKVDWQGVTHEHAMVDGLPTDTILAESAEVDLVAMGTHGRTGLAAALLGGVTYAVLRRSHTPVLAVRAALAD